MLVYVTAIIVVMVRQFRMLNTLEEDTNRLLVVNTEGNTEVESLRWILDIWRKYPSFISLDVIQDSSRGFKEFRLRGKSNTLNVIVILFDKE